MPTYEYACTACGQHVEVFQRLSEPALETCGVCGGPLRKVFHPAGIVFKGSGFYATDSRAAPKTDAGGAPGAEKKSGAAKKDAPASSSDASGDSSSPSSKAPASGGASGEKAS